MDLISLIIAGLLVLLTGAFVVLMVLAIMFNLKAGQRYRANLAKRLDQLRLGTDQCDDQLADGAVRRDEIDFCNNERSLQEMLKTNRSETS